jgi:hypothetical protein
MFKLAAGAAVVAAGSADFKETAEMFKVTLKQEEVEGLEHHAQALERESMKYEHQMQGSHHGKQFEAEVHAVANTKEFHALGHLIEAIHKRGPTPQIKKFKQIYMAQMHKVEMAHRQLERTSEKTSRMEGANPHQRLHINIDNDEWIVFNKEYYKLREMEYYAMYKIPEVVAIRGKVTAVRHTAPFGAIQKHWAEVTHQDQHQVVVHHQAELVKAAVETLHMDPAEEKWLDPKHVPVMFETWHMIYLYFVAMGHGDLDPMLDFIIDGKYDEHFVHEVDPQFGAFGDDLMLF